MMLTEVNERRVRNHTRRFAVHSRAQMLKPIVSSISDLLKISIFFIYYELW